MQETLIQEYEVKDRDKCIKLLSNTFQKTSNESTFKWRFESSFRIKPIIICAKHQEKVVSFNSWLPWEFNYNKRANCKTL